VWLPYADPSATLLLQLNFGDVPDRRYLWTTGRGRLAPLAAPPSLTENSPGGSYFWDQVGAATVKCLPQDDLLLVCIVLFLVLHWFSAALLSALFCYWSSVLVSAYGMGLLVPAMTLSLLTYLPSVVDYWAIKQSILVSFRALVSAPSAQSTSFIGT
jgi:hypothetical protein